MSQHTQRRTNALRYALAATSTEVCVHGAYFYSSRGQNVAGWSGCRGPTARALSRVTSRHLANANANVEHFCGFEVLLGNIRRRTPRRNSWSARAGAGCANAIPSCVFRGRSWNSKQHKRRLNIRMVPGSLENSQETRDRPHRVSGSQSSTFQGRRVVQLPPTSRTIIPATRPALRLRDTACASRVRAVDRPAACALEIVRARHTSHATSNATRGRRSPPPPPSRMRTAAHSV